VAEKLAEVETSLLELTAVRNELRKLLQDWDQRLDSIPAEEPAKLLETMSVNGFADGRAASLLKPTLSKRKTNKEAKQK
ncbi:MAG TPA: hypothetical protein PLQ88_27490, partial [Blastocatellia bacterium]|nr:hypothetical protein [Blastocatellia bacterium]